MKTNLIAFLTVIPLLISCNMNGAFHQISGNGNVITETRTISAEFEELRGSSGLDVFITQGDRNEVRVEADENLHEFISTEVSGGKLHIKSLKNIHNATSRKVYVTYKHIHTLEASSGADVSANSVIKAENVYLKSSSGADLNAEVFTKELTAQSSSGSDIKVSGQAKHFVGSASSGSNLHAKSLQTLTSKAKASSGASLTINVKEALEAHASSGGDIKYYGKPAKVNRNKSSSGSVKQM